MSELERQIEDSIAGISTTTSTGDWVISAGVTNAAAWSNVADGPVSVRADMEDGSSGFETARGMWTSATNTITRATVKRSTSGNGVKHDFPAGNKIIALIVDAETLRHGIVKTTVDNIAALRLITGGVVKYIDTAGFTTIGDKGGARFYWDASSSATDNGASIILPTDHVGNGRWLMDTAGKISVRAFGAKMDGSTDDSAAVLLSAQTLGYVYVPEGSLAMATQVVIPSETTFYGDGMGVSKIIVKSTFGTDAILFTCLGQSGGVRQTKNLNFRDITFDDQRVWPSHPTTGWDDNGYLFYLQHVDKYNFTRVEVKNCQNNPIRDVGCKDGTIVECDIHDNGRDEAFSPAVMCTPGGTAMVIVDISAADPPVVTVWSHNETWPTTATTCKLFNIVGYDLPDGEYNIDSDDVSLSANQFILTDEDTSAEGTYEVNLRAYAGVSGTTGEGFMPSENTTCVNNKFRNNAFHHVCFNAWGGMLAHNEMMSDDDFDYGESAIFTSLGHDLEIVHNRIDRNTVVGVIAAGIEANNIANSLIESNIISRTGTGPIQITGGQDTPVRNNIFSECVSDNAQTFPATPISAGGGAINRNYIVRLASLDKMPVSNCPVSGNVVIDRRKDPQALEGVALGRDVDVDSTNDQVYDIDIEHNDFTRSGIAAADHVVVKTTNVCPDKVINIKNNKGHASQMPVVINYENAISTTPNLKYDLGFVPSHLIVEAWNSSSSRVWKSRCDIMREPDGTVTYEGSTEASESGGFRCVALSGKAYRLQNYSGTTQAQGRINAFLCDNTAIGIQVTTEVATVAHFCRITCFP